MDSHLGRRGGEEARSVGDGDRARSSSSGEVADGRSDESGGEHGVGDLGREGGRGVFYGKIAKQKAELFLLYKTKKAL